MIFYYSLEAVRGCFSLHYRLFLKKDLVFSLERLVSFWRCPKAEQLLELRSTAPCDRRREMSYTIQAAAPSFSTTPHARRGAEAHHGLKRSKLTQTVAQSVHKGSRFTTKDLCLHLFNFVKDWTIGSFYKVELANLKGKPGNSLNSLIQADKLEAAFTF